MNKPILILLLSIWCLSSVVSADALVLSSKDLNNPERSFLLTSWQYQGKVRDTLTLPDPWPGKGVFDLEIRPEPDAAERPIALYIRQGGTVKMHLNGRLLLESRENDRWMLNPFLISLPAGKISSLKVEYGCPDPDYYTKRGMFPGFMISLQAWEVSQQYMLGVWNHFIFLMGITFAFAMLHFFFFVFRPDVRIHLYFSMLAFCIAVLMLTELDELLVHRGSVILSRRTWGITQILADLFVLRFVYALYTEKIPRQFYLFAAASVLLLVWSWNRVGGGWISPANALYYISLFTIVVLAEVLRVLFFSKKTRDEAGVRILRWGSTPVVLAALYQMLVNIQLTEPLTLFLEFIPLPYYAFLFLLLSMSIYVSQKVAKTDRDLERQAAENQRKTAELEEARLLQLSMLPEARPEIPGLDIAFYMKPASEVGGDYYDYALKNGVLTIAIGDATGHGLKAGTMVAAVKSIFQTLADDENIPAIFAKMSETLRRMQMGKNFMAMIIAKIQDQRIKFSSAGMPPALVYRKSSRVVEEFRPKGVPLGAAQFPYELVELKLEAGDVLLFMSDGFPEMFNRERKILGYDRAAKVLRHSGTRPADDIIGALVRDAERWSEGHPSEDDVTFLVVKVREQVGV